MVQICSAVNCRNKSDKENGISMHRFPLNNPKLLAKWVQAVQRYKWKPTKHSQLCSAHFEKDDFYPDQSKKQLREDVVPSIFAHRPVVKKRPPPKVRKNLEVRSKVSKAKENDTKVIVYILPIVISSSPSTSN